MNRLLITAIAIMAVTTMQAQGLQYPKAAKDGTVDEYFGTKVADPYRWLENDTSQQTAQWVEAENKVTNAYLKGIPFRQKLLNRLTELVNYEKVGAPAKHHGKWYLDPNTLSTDGTVALKGIYFAHNGKWAAYSISRSGSDWQEFYVIDLKTGKLTNDHIEWAKFSGAAWRGDGFYYSTYDRPTEGR